MTVTHRPLPVREAQVAHEIAAKYQLIGDTQLSRPDQKTLLKLMHAFCKKHEGYGIKEGDSGGSIYGVGDDCGWSPTNYWNDDSLSTIIIGIWFSAHALDEYEIQRILWLPPLNIKGDTGNILIKYVYEKLQQEQQSTQIHLVTL